MNLCPFFYAFLSLHNALFCTFLSTFFCNFPATKFLVAEIFLKKVRVTNAVINIFSVTYSHLSATKNDTKKAIFI